MAKVTPLWPGFSAGELSRRVLSNSDLDIYRNGLYRCHNWVTTPQGSIIKRNGFMHVFADANSRTQGRILAYPIDSEREIAFVLMGVDLHVAKYTTLDYGSVLEPDNITTYNPTLPGTWTNFGDRFSQINIPPSGQGAYFIHPNNTPHAAQRVGDNNANDFEIVEISFTNAPSDWGAGNYPSCGTFFQGRWWLSGCPDNPSKIYGSKIDTGGSYFDFTTGANPEDAFDLELDDYGTIKWIKGLKNLLIGTDQGEFIITSEGTVVHTGDFKIEQQSAYGSIDSDAVRVGNTVVFITPDGRKLRDTRYRWEEDAWTSKDLTFRADHISEETRLRTVAFQQNPNNILWCATRTDGEEQGDNSRIVACTFEKDLNIISFHDHEVEGDIVDLQVSRYNGVSVPMCIINRDLNGTDTLQFEIMNPDVFMDGSVKIVNGSATDAITGQTHLAGSTVSVVADGAVHPDITLDASGNGTLDYDATTVYLGFHKNAEAETLPMDYTNQTGSTPGWAKRWNKIFVRLLNSHIPLVNGDRAAERDTEDLMDDATPLIVDDDVSVSSLGFSNRGTITIVSDSPLRCEITGIFGEMGQNLT